MANYLVSGATGFVGREIIRQLLNAGHQVATIGRSASSGPVRHIKADICQPIQSVRMDEPLDCIMHIASLPGDTGDPQQMLDVNLDGCLHMLELARSLRVRHFILASSISAYEWYPATAFHAPDYLPVDEAHLCRPKDMYSVTKRMQELLCLTYYHQYGVPTTCLRLTAVIGPNGKGGGRGWRAIAEELAGGKTVHIPHFSKEELCHYVDIRDVGRMFIAASENDASIGEIFNCCGPQAVTGGQFCDAIRAYYPDIDVQFNFPWSMAQGGKIAFSMEKAKRILGFQPEYSLGDSIRSIKEWIDGGGLLENEAADSVFTSGVQK